MTTTMVVAKLAGIFHKNNNGGTKLAEIFHDNNNSGSKASGNIS